MVYNEGFNIDFEDLSFFAFSKYIIDKSNPSKIEFDSMCYSTCVGWYHNKDKTKWGCYQAKKLNVDPSEITRKDSKNDVNILEPTNNLENNIIDSMLNMRFKSFDNEISIVENISNSNNLENINNSLNNKNLNKHKLKYNLRNSNNINNSFLQLQTLEKEQTKMFLSASFKNHALYLSKLNKIQKNWNAEVNPQFSQMTIKELNKFAGISRSKYQKTSRNIIKKVFKKEDLSEFPKNFNLKNFLRPAGSQGNCGSCYAYSTIRMIEARLKILYSHDVHLSVQHALDCAIYNQGCDGGYPFLVMKFANEYDLIPEICKPYYVRLLKFLFI